MPLKDFSFMYQSFYSEYLSRTLQGEYQNLKEVFLESDGIRLVMFDGTKMTVEYPSRSK